MKKNLRRLITLLGAAILLAAMFPAAPVHAQESKPALTVTVKPQIGICTAISTIKYVVTITNNTSGERIDNIRAFSVLGGDLIGVCALVEGISLRPGKSYTFSYSARIRALKGLDVILAPLATLRDWLFPFGDVIAIMDDDRDGVQASGNVTLLSLSSYDVSTAVTVYHDEPTPDMSDAERELALQLLNFKRDPSGCFYVEHQRWGRDFGFNQIYDLASPLIQLVYGTVRVKFPYDGKDWLIQMWKGRYGIIMLGGEIGVYNKPSTQASEFYYSALPEEELVMSMDVYQKNLATGVTKKLFTRGPLSDWWLTGFVPGTFYQYNNKAEIILVGSIEFPNEEMLQAFEAAFAATGFAKGTPERNNPETYAIDGTTVTFAWQYVDMGA